MAESRRGLLGRLFGGEPPPSPVPDEAAVEKASTNEEVSARAETTSGSWWQRLKSGLSRSTQSLTTGIADVFTKRKLDAESLEDLEDLLLKADLGSETSARIVAALSRQRHRQDHHDRQARRSLPL